MKGIDILCASQAATAIRMMDEGSSSSSTIHLGSGRAIDRYNPIIRDSTRIPKSLPKTPCSSNNQPPITPKPRDKNKNTTNSKGSSSTSLSKRNKNIDDDLQKRKSSSSTTSVNSHKQSFGGSVGESKKGGWGCAKPGDFISPPGSTRYLLSERGFLSDFEPILNLAQAVKKEESSVSLPPPSSSRSPDQVVVLRVSLHCKGCERKMKKHISRMEGVTSFNIDFAAKKVTVIGDVTPLSVLASVSKVKNAQLLAPTISSSAPEVASDRSDIKNFKAVVV